MTDNSIKNDINREDNISITTQLTNMKNKFDEEFNNESSKITKLINYLEKLSLEFNQLYLNFYDNKQKLNSSNENNIVILILFIYFIINFLKDLKIYQI